MRKWIVPDVDKMGAYKLVADSNPPSNAVCEAPESYTRAMEPYFVVNEIKQNGSIIRGVSLSDKWDADRATQDYLAARKARYINERDWYNSLNPLQRAFINIFGKRAHKPRTKLGSSFSKKILKDKRRS